jgi:rubrerythrin
MRENAWKERSRLIDMILNADEILKIAEQIERNGLAFYERAAERFQGGEQRTLLDLAKMERNHERAFASMRRELADADEGLTAFDPDGEAEKHLAAFADGKIFDLNADPVALLDGQDSVRGILELAIGLEKDSVVFYVTIKEAVPENLGKDRIERIIKEEIDHIILLSGILSSLAK